MCTIADSEEQYKAHLKFMDDEREREEKRPPPPKRSDSSVGSSDGSGPHQTPSSNDSSSDPERGNPGAVDSEVTVWLSQLHIEYVDLYAKKLNDEGFDSLDAIKTLKKEDMVSTSIISFLLPFFALALHFV